MSKYNSMLAPAMGALLAYRTALGYSPKTHEHHFLSIDRFYSEKYPNLDRLTQSTVVEWFCEQCGDWQSKATAVRILGRYLSAIGQESYVLPTKVTRSNKAGRYEPYMFSDAKLTLLFHEIDSIEATKAEPFLNEMLPVLFRLIYTCGLRPNEGRELKCQNINLETGEVLITETKGKKDRLVVTSADMLNLCRSYNDHRAIFSKGNPYFFPA